MRSPNSIALDTAINKLPNTFMDLIDLHRAVSVRVDVDLLALVALAGMSAGAAMYVAGQASFFSFDEDSREVIRAAMRMLNEAFPAGEF